MKQWTLAVANYESAYDRFPRRSSESGLSWRVELLPFIEESKLHEAIDHSAAWDAASNTEFHKPVPHGLKCHNREDSSSNTQLVGVHSDNSFWRDEETTFDDISDRNCDTLVFIELDLPDVHWMSPNDVTLEDLIELLERDGRLPSLHSAGVLMSFADVSVRCVPHEKITPEFLRAIVSINGGEIIDP